MIGIADQYGLRRHESHFNDLANDTVRVDNRLAIVDAMLLPDGNDEIVAIRVGIHGHDFGDADFAAYVAPRLQQFAQASVFRL